MRSRKVAIVAVVLVALVLVFQVPIRVRWHAQGLASSDPNTRAASRTALLAIGRPAIDSIYPDLVAQEVLEEASVPGALVVVGARRPACVLQRGERDCGGAALATFAAQHGIRISLDEASRLAGTSESGTSMLSLKHGVEALGFLTKAAKLEPGADAGAILALCSTPYIAHMEVRVGPVAEGHWVVVSHASTTEVELEDPAVGWRRLPLGAFRESWTEKLLLGTRTSGARPRDPYARSYEVVETLAGKASVGEPLLAWGPVVCPTALALWREDSSAELAVLAPRDGVLEVRLAVPLDEADRAPLVAAVRARLGAR